MALGTGPGPIAMEDIPRIVTERNFVKYENGKMPAAFKLGTDVAYGIDGMSTVHWIRGIYYFDTTKPLIAQFACVDCETTAEMLIWDEDTEMCWQFLFPSEFLFEFFEKFAKVSREAYSSKGKELRATINCYLMDLWNEVMCHYDNIARIEYKKELLFG